MQSQWQTGFPADLEASDLVEVEHRSGAREVLEVCEVDWHRSDAIDPYSPALDDEVVRFRLLKAA